MGNEPKRHNVTGKGEDRSRASTDCRTGGDLLCRLASHDRDTYPSPFKSPYLYINPDMLQSAQSISFILSPQLKICLLLLSPHRLQLFSMALRTSASKSVPSGHQVLTRSRSPSSRLVSAVATVRVLYFSSFYMVLILQYSALLLTWSQWRFCCSGTPNSWT